MLNPIVLVPAYGVTYGSQAEMLLAWNAGKDFRDWRGTGQYCSIRDLQELSYLTSSITLVDPRTRVSVQIEPLDQFTMPMARRMLA